MTRGIAATGETAAREIVSESKLTVRHFQSIGADLALAVPDDGPAVGHAEIEAIVEAGRAGIRREIGRSRKYAESNLADLPPGCIYDHLGVGSWRTAARICEVFRNPKTSKNAGRLDTQTLQRLVHDRLERSDTLDFTIAWGQPKRDAGRLKTLGPMADLAEFHALVRLGCIVGAVRACANRPVRLSVLTGGSRFFPALFTRPGLTRAYDRQRQRLADALCGEGAISVRAFVDEDEVEGTAGVEADRLARLERAVARVDDDAVWQKVDTIVMNVDWQNVFSDRPEGPGAAEPHGLTIPPALRRWLARADESSRDRLVRAAIVAMRDPRRLSDCLAAFGHDEDVVEEALSFMQRVAWESARKYIALHAMDAEDDSAGLDGPDETIRLTVHEKRDRREVPAIFTLGPEGGNLLSQHVLAVVGSSGPFAFETVAELSGRPVSPVFVRDATARDAFAFDWLNGQRQPLCFLEDGTDDPAGAIGRVLGDP